MYKYILLGFGIVVVMGVWVLVGGQKSGSSQGTELVVESESEVAQGVVTVPPPSTDRSLRRSESITLPLPNSAPTTDVLHTIAIEDIRQGCFRQDCIPSVDFPQFVTPAELTAVLDPASIGIALSYGGEERFYPFPMLETHELVNDEVAGDPLLVSYCPLCGTGIVFDRRVDGEVMEFGVSGMLWNSNLLMYNRAANIDERNLWSQVLGEAVVGARASERLTIVPSDIMRFGDWSATYPDGLVLTTGTPRDPYNGNYYGVARSFAPAFDERNSPLAPDAYVYGVIIDDVPVAYPDATLPVGTTEHVVDDTLVTIEKTAAGNVRISVAGEQVSDVEGFWFSWVAAYPETVLWSQDS